MLIQRLGAGPATLYGMSAGVRSNMILAARYPEDVAALVIAPLTGGPIAAMRLSEEYYLKYLSDDSLTSWKKWPRRHSTPLPVFWPVEIKA